MHPSDHDHSYHMDTRDPFSVDTNANTDTETVPTHSATHTHTTGGHSSHRGMTRTLDQDEAGDFKCPQADDIVFSSLDTHFSFYVFVEQFIFHVFFPLTVPIAWYRFGMKHSRIQQYHYRDPVAYVSTYIPLLCMVAALWSLYAEPDVLRLEQLRLPFGVLLLQRMMISVKYASLSPDEYESFLSIGGTTFFAKLSASDLETSRRYTSNMQINSGWIVIPDSLIKHELVVSSVVQGIDLPNLFFYIPVSSSSPTREGNPEKMYDDWMRLLKEPGSEYNLKRERSGALVNISDPHLDSMRTANNQYLKVNCMDVCEYMFHVVNKRVSGVLKYNFAFAMALSSILVYVYWLSYGSLFHRSIQTKIFLVSTMYLLFFFTPVLFMFCVAIMTDIFRRYQLGRMLKELISVSDIRMVDTRLYERFRSSKRRQSAVKLQACAFQERRQLKSFNTTALPRIDMSVPANYISWCMCRQVLSRFGSRFLFRTSLYLGILALLVLIQATSTLIDIFFSSLSNDDVCRSFNFAAAVFIIGIVGILMCILMTGVHMTNRRMKKHRIQISMHLLQANKALHELVFSESVNSVCDGRIHGNTTGRSNRKRHGPQHGSNNESDGSDHTPLTTEKEEAIEQLQECIESANGVVQTLVEYDDVEPLKLMNMHVEKEYVVSVMSSMIVYGLVLYNYCDEGANLLST